MTPDYLESTRKRLMSRTVVMDSCWLWNGAIGRGGYGKLHFDGHVVDAHRVMWTLEHGEIPPGGIVAHKCDVRHCVNPEHLFLTTQAGNLADMHTKARHARGPALSAAIRAGWTPELRARRGADVRRLAAERRIAKRHAAGAPDGWKRCATCGEWKPPTEFHKRSLSADGLNSVCKACRSVRRAD